MSRSSAPQGAGALPLIHTFGGEFSPDEPTRCTPQSRPQRPRTRARRGATTPAGAAHHALRPGPPTPAGPDPAPTVCRTHSSTTASHTPLNRIGHSPARRQTPHTRPRPTRPTRHARHHCTRPQNTARDSYHAATTVTTLYGAPQPHSDARHAPHARARTQDTPGRVGPRRTARNAPRRQCFESHTPEESI